MLDQLTSADEFAALRAELRQRDKEIALLRETTQAIGSELDLDKVFALIADRARALIDAETVLVPIIDQDRNHYTYRAGVGAQSDEIVGESLPLEYGVCGWVLRHRRPWWRGTLAELSEQERNLWERQAGTLILVPLVGRRQFLGGIAGLTKCGGGEFNQNDLHLLELFAGQAAIAIENAMAIETLEQSRQVAEETRRELQRLNKRLSAANQELEYLSLYDSLTGLPNRSLFRDRMRQELAEATAAEAPLALLIVDIDRFQELNDSLGHEAGDELLRTTAARLAKLAQTGATVARMSGDEFALLLNQDESAAIAVARSLRDVLAQPLRLAGQEMSVTAAIGIACFPEHGTDISTLFKAADAAMLAAKRERTGIQLFDPQRDSGMPARFALMRDLRQALDKGEFRLHYQPKVELATGRLDSVEALARWQRGDGVAVPPDMFISALEQTDLIAPFTYWALATAMAQRQAWLERGWDLEVAVNVPLSVVMDTRFLPALAAIVGGRCARSGLVLEITENIFLGDYDRINGVLSELRGYGVGCSIDDFGTGHSSLARLRQLPVGEIKVDRSFVMAMIDNKDDEVIVRSTIDLAHNLGLRVVAEGVENARLMQVLAQLRCDVVQGYHISRPLPADDLATFIERCPWAVATVPRNAAEG